MTDQKTEEELPVITTEKWEQRKKFVNFAQEDQEILRECHLFARNYADKLMDALYQHWLQFNELKSFFPDEATINRVKSLQREYFIQLTNGTYETEYLNNRLRVGKVHARVGLTPQWYMGAYAIYLELVLPEISRAFEYDKSKQRRAITALAKLIILDQELALLSYFGNTKLAFSRKDAQQAD